MKAGSRYICGCGCGAEFEAIEQKDDYRWIIQWHIPPEREDEYRGDNLFDSRSPYAPVEFEKVKEILNKYE